MHAAYLSQVKGKWTWQHTYATVFSQILTKILSPIMLVQGQGQGHSIKNVKNSLFIHKSMCFL